MTPAEAEAIKPCPFCGNSEAEYINIYGAMKVFIRCKHCEGDGPPRSTKAEAIKAWNTRHPEPAPAPSTTLPTTPGMYWWRASESCAWGLVDITPDIDGEPCLFRVIKPWKSRIETVDNWPTIYGIGQWLPCRPPEREVQG